MRSSVFPGVLAVLLLAGSPLAAATGDEYRLEAASKTEVNQVLAEVNGVPVTLGDVLLESWPQESQAYAVFSGDDLEAAIVDIRKQTLQDLVDRELVVADFEAKSMKLDQQRIESLIDLRARELGCSGRAELEKKLHQFQLTMADVRKQARERLMLESMIANVCYVEVNVTPRELHEYIEAHRGDFVEPARIRLRLFKLDAERPDLEKVSAEAAEAMKRPNAAERFPELVSLWSDGPGRTAGGDLGWIETRRLRREFAAALGDSPEAGTVVGPVTVDKEGVYYLCVSELAAAREPEWAEVRIKLRRELETKLRGEAIQKYLKGLRAGALIRFAQ